jgi:hypothetical protein
LDGSGESCGPELWQRAFGAEDWIGGWKLDAAHAIEDLCCGGGAADIPVLAGWIGADDEEIIRGRDAAVAGSGGKYEDVPGASGDDVAVFLRRA